MNKFELGTEAKDCVTGFKGIIMYRVDYLTGCSQYGLQPAMDKKGDIPEAKQFDENRIELTGKKITLPEDKTSKEKPVPGGPNYIAKHSH